jgi:outer membrane scaffolding protein for murein synthesis (MipA/OmpV family)
VADVDENALRTGVALSYQPGRRWTVSASYDYDRVRSDIASRSMTRHRCGVSVIRVF